jgi:CRISPR/Cas system CMR-associated protein Cmr3 (group 5 of RAMP superfamily)
MTGERWVVLEPLDTIVVRDGRAFDAGLQSVARTSVPTPGTLAGAIGAAFGARPGAGLDPAARGRDVPDRLLGPVPVVDRDGEWRARWPVPLDVVRDDDHPSPCRLTVTGADGHPGGLDGVTHDLGGDVRALPIGAGEPVAGWWETAELAGYLTGGDVSGDTMPEPWRIERRVGLALEEDRTAAEGMLYSAEHLRPAERMGFAVCCIGGPDAPLPQTVPLGGRNRSAQLHADVKPPALPEPAAHAPDGRLLLYLATPAVFEHGWRPDLTAWPGAGLITAVVGDPQVIAAATPDRATGAVGRGRLMWAAPAGSVYFLKFGSEHDALHAARTLNRRTLPQAEEPLASAGFGYALTGSW